MRKLHSQIWVAISFSPGFPGLRFPDKWLWCGSRPHQRVCEVVTPPAPTRTTQQRGLLSFISELVIEQINIFDGLVGFEGSGKSLSVLKTTAPETYTGRKISPSYQLRSVFGLLKAGYTCYFHTYLRVPTPARLQIVEPLTVIRSIGSRWSSKLPPRRPPGLDSLIANWVVSEGKSCEGFVDAKNIGQDLEDM